MTIGRTRDCTYQRMKILIDMNLPPRLAELLGNGGIDAEHWSNLGASDAPDSEIIEFAKNNDYIVLTFGLDFSAILASTQDDKPSVIQLRACNTTPEEIVVPIINAVKQMQTDLIEGVLLTIDLNRARLRLLPLKAATREYNE